MNLKGKQSTFTLKTIKFLKNKQYENIFLYCFLVKIFLKRQDNLNKRSTYLKI